MFSSRHAGAEPRADADYDRNLNGFIKRGTIKAAKVKVVWTSDPLPNDPLVARAGLDTAMIKKIQDSVLAITEEQALTLIDAVSASHSLASASRIASCAWPRQLSADAMPTRSCATPATS